MKWRRNKSLDHKFKKAQLINKYGNLCCVCNIPFNNMKDITIDHWIPLSKGGTDDIDNLRLAHRKCNTLKADILPGSSKYQLIIGKIVEKP